MKSDNNIVKTIFMMGVNGLYSVLSANYRVLCTKYGMNVNNIMKVRNEKCKSKEEIIIKCEQVRELYEVRDRCVTSIFKEGRKLYNYYFFYIHITFLPMSFFFNLKCAMYNGNKELPNPT